MILRPGIALLAASYGFASAGLAIGGSIEVILGALVLAALGCKVLEMEQKTDSKKEGD